MKSVPLSAIAKLVNGTVEGVAADDVSTILIDGVNTLSAAGDTEISFLANQRYKSTLSETIAAAVLLSADDPAPEHCAVIRVADPYLAFAQLQRFFHPHPQASGKIHSTAAIDPSAQLADDVDVGAHAVIGAGVQIGAGSMIGAACVIGDDTRVGERCIFHPGAVIRERCVVGNDVILQPGAVIGSDGFGYAWTGSQHLKIPQAGRVILEDDVEIGANTCIDRGAIDDTVIERGVKLDNQIQVAHNVRIGAYSIMASQVGISGSTTIGKGCQFGGQAGLAGHLHIGDGVKLTAQAGVLSDLDAGGTYAGSPAIPYRLFFKVSALMHKLPEMWKAQQRK